MANNGGCVGKFEEYGWEAYEKMRKVLIVYAHANDPYPIAMNA